MNIRLPEFDDRMFNDCFDIIGGMTYKKIDYIFVSPKMADYHGILILRKDEKYYTMIRDQEILDMAERVLTGVVDFVKKQDDTDERKGSEE